MPDDPNNIAAIFGKQLREAMREVDLPSSYVMWTSDDKPIGDIMAACQVSNANNCVNTNGFSWIDSNGNLITTNVDPGITWIDPNSSSGGGISGGSYGGGYVPGTTTIYPPSVPTITIPPWPTTPTAAAEENDQEGNKVVRAPKPSVEQILVEVAKVLRDGGSLLEIREIFERHKLKLVDHDGEVIFDPKRDIKLEDKNF